MKISNKYGVNPGMSVCFWCGEVKEIILFGTNRGEKAKHSACYNYEPCDKCKKNMEKGITLIEIEETYFDDPRAIQDNLIPTGQCIIITEDAAKRLFNNKDIIEKRKAFIDSELFNKLLGTNSSTVEPTPHKRSDTGSNPVLSTTTKTLH